MKDIKGQELNIGDEVVFIKGKNSLTELDIGKIIKFYKGSFNEEECSVGRYTHIQSHRIMKL